jgi:hypothetical protein
VIFAEASTQNRESAASLLGTGERIEQDEKKRESDKNRQESTGRDPKQQDPIRSDEVRSGIGKKRKELRIIGNIGK